MFNSAKFHQHSISISFYPLIWLRNIYDRLLSYLFRMESFANEKCVLCKEEFETTPTSVQQKGYKTLLRISRERSMLELTNDLINRKDSGQQILVHFDCRRKFADTRKKVNQINHLKSYDLHLIMHFTGNSIVLFVQSQLILAMQTNLTSLKSWLYHCVII